MKAKIINETVFDDSFMHIQEEPDTRQVRRLIVEEADNLAITLTPCSNDINIFTGFHALECNYKVLREIEIPDELVEKAIACIRAAKELESLKDTCRDMCKTFIW